MAQTQITTKDRVKSLLGLSGTTHDTVLDNIINGVSAFIEGICNRQFKSATYTDEIYEGVKSRFLYLNQFPITSLTSVFYNSGSLAVPVWVAFDANYYVLDARNNCIYFDAGMPIGFRNIKVTYVAGYVIDYATPANHTLPYDLSMVAEQIVSKVFGKRKSEGSSSESIDGANVSYEKDITTEQRMVISKYSKVIY